LKFLKIFGALYFLLNLIFFVAMTVLTVGAAEEHAFVFSDFICLAVPLLGMIAGFWFYVGRPGWIKKLLIGVSLLCTGVTLFISFGITPQLEKLKKEQAADNGTAQSSVVDKAVERLFLGVYSDNIAIVIEQLAKGVDVNARNKTGETPLHVTQDPAIAKLLIEYGADINARDDLGMVPVFNKELPTAKVLFAAGTDINIRSERGNTLLIWWAYSGYLEGMKYLVEHGIDINACNIDYHNALDIAEELQPNNDALNYLQTLNIQPCPK
jgi:hypothetical protein